MYVSMYVICQQVGFSRATNLSDIAKNERNVPNVHCKLWTSPKCHKKKNQKKLLNYHSWRKYSMKNAVKWSLPVIWPQSSWESLEDGSLLAICKFPFSLYAIKAMTPDTKKYFGHSVLVKFSHGSSDGISSPASLGEETFESQSTSQS